MKTQPSKPIYVAFYTADTAYEKEIISLKKSLEHFNLPHDIQSIPSLGSWQKNTKYKAVFIQNMLFKYPERPIVYLDSDAIVRQYPTLFDEIQCDIAVHYYDDNIRTEKELLSGTLYLEPTQKTKELVQLWRYINEEYPRQWEQKNLGLALKFTPDVRILDLPPSYCLIFDLMKGQGEPVIEHFQASRRHKQEIDNNETE